MQADREHVQSHAMQSRGLQLTSSWRTAQSDARPGAHSEPFQAKQRITAHKLREGGKKRYNNLLTSRNDDAVRFCQDALEVEQRLAGFQLGKDLGVAHAHGLQVPERIGEQNEEAIGNTRPACTST